MEYCVRSVCVLIVVILAVWAFFLCEAISASVSFLLAAAFDEIAL